MSSKFQVVHSKYLGRSLVATEDLPSGTVIISDDPPISMVAYDNDNDTSSSGTRSKYTLRPHELSLLAIANRFLGQRYQGTSVILAARIMEIVKSNISVQAAVSSLCRKPSADRGAYREQLNTPATITQKLLSAVNIDATLVECEDTLSRIACNAFTIVDAYDHGVGVGLYGSLASAINHACDPNAMQSFHSSSSSEHALSITTVKPIKKDEEITISYIDVGASTWHRRSELQEGYGFICSCSKCSYDGDTMEEDGILCLSCNQGSYSIAHVMQYQAYMMHVSMKMLSSFTSSTDHEWHRFVHEWCLPHAFTNLHQLTTHNNIDYNMMNKDMAMTCCHCHRAYKMHSLLQHVHQLFILWQKIHHMERMLHTDHDNRQTHATYRQSLDAHKQAIDILSSTIALTTIDPRNKVITSYCATYSDYIHHSAAIATAISYDDLEAYLHHALQSIPQLRIIYPTQHKGTILRVLQIMRMLFTLLDRGMAVCSWCQSRSWFHMLKSEIHDALAQLRKYHPNLVILQEELKFYARTINC